MRCYDAKVDYFLTTVQLSICFILLIPQEFVLITIFQQLMNGKFFQQFTFNINNNIHP